MAFLSPHPWPFLIGNVVLNSEFCVRNTKLEEERGQGEGSGRGVRERGQGEGRGRGARERGEGEGQGEG